MILQSLVSSRKFDCQPRTMIDTPSRCGPIEWNSGQSKLSQKHFDIQLCKNISYLRINLNGQSGQSQSLKIGYCRLTSCRFRNNGRIISLRKAISACGISGFSIFKFQILSFKVCFTGFEDVPFESSLVRFWLLLDPVWFIGSLHQRRQSVNQ